MKDFKEFLFEEFDYLIEASKASERLSNDRAKIGGHIANYIAPFLSKKERKAMALSSEIFADKFSRMKNQDKDGELHNPDPNATTHEVGISQPGVPAGTKVRVTGIVHSRDADGKLVTKVKTKNHGELPLTSIMKPTSLRRAPITKTGFDVEGKISENLGWKPAGSSKHGYDYAYNPEHPKGIRGKVVETSTGVPLLRGESKLIKGKMGDSALNWDSGKGWYLTNADVKDSFSKAQVTGPDGKNRKLIDHLNTFHSNGIIEKGFSMQAPKGTAREYLTKTNKNSVHLHETDAKKGIDRGTTYTIGDNNPLRGQTGLGHISDKELENFDGKIEIGRTTPGLPGRTAAVHRPHKSVMQEYASRSETNPDEHMNLYNPEHAEKFRKTISKLIKEHQAS